MEFWNILNAMQLRYSKMPFFATFGWNKLFSHHLSIISTSISFDLTTHVEHGESVWIVIAEITCVVSVRESYGEGCSVVIIFVQLPKVWILIVTNVTAHSLPVWMSFNGSFQGVTQRLHTCENDHSFCSKQEAHIFLSYAPKESLEPPCGTPMKLLTRIL